MLKVMTVLGTRPEIIKMCRVSALLDQNSHHIIVFTGQNYDYELSQIFFDDLEFRKPDYFLEAGDSSPIRTVANIFVRFEDVLLKEKPDAILFYGDTNSCLGVIVAKRYKIPIFHMEAGNRCFNENVPEELNRKVVDHLSDINLVLTEHARRYLISEGIRQDRIIKTGSHMREVLTHFSEKIEKSKILEKEDLRKGDYFLVSIHREENVDDQKNLEKLLGALNSLAKKYQKKIIVSTHPRTQKRLENLSDFKMDEHVIFLPPFGFFDYITLQKNAFLVISDSGTITEETDILKLKSVAIRNEHERPEGMDSGTLVMSGLDSDSVINSVQLVLNFSKKAPDNIENIQDYIVQNVSEKIVKIIYSYTGYVNRNVWGKV